MINCRLTSAYIHNPNENIVLFLTHISKENIEVFLMHPVQTVSEITHGFGKHAINSLDCFGNFSQQYYFTAQVVYHCRVCSSRRSQSLLLKTR